MFHIVFSMKLTKHVIHDFNLHKTFMRLLFNIKRIDNVYYNITIK